MLISIGCTLVRICTEIDAYYSHPCRDFAKTDEALRFRRRTCSDGSTNYIISYKGPRQHTNIQGLKVREEQEIAVDEEETWLKLRSIFERLGFKLVASFAKNREMYSGIDFEAYLDTLIGVGHFIEIEAKKRESRELLERLMLHFMRTLGASVVDKTYLEICLETGSCTTS